LLFFGALTASFYFYLPSQLPKMDPEKGMIKREVQSRVVRINVFSYATRALHFAQYHDFNRL